MGRGQMSSKITVFLKDREHGQQCGDCGREGVEKGIQGINGDGMKLPYS